MNDFQDNPVCVNEFLNINIMTLNLNTYETHSKYSPKACIIWMHGLGSDAQNMMGIAAAFPEELAISHVFVDAPIRPVAINNHMPMRAWYNVLGMKLTDREDKEGIITSAKNISSIIDLQIAKGFHTTQIFLAGFSQGGAMALFTGLTSKLKLGGIISLSGYLPLLSELQKTNYHDTPIFIGLGEHDLVVLPEWTNASYNWLIQQKFNNISLHKYPMEHNICIEEIRDLYNWLNSQISHKPVVEKI